jgi:hypothetical protein
MIILNESSHLPSYIAGIIDGEGCITIKLSRKNSKRAPCYTSDVAVSMSNEEVIKLLHQRYGGTYWVRTFPNEDWRAMYCWAIGNQGCQRVLEEVLPFLIVKKKQAEFCLKLCAEKQSGRSVPLTEEEIAYRTSLYLSCKDLNKRGKVRS